MATTASLDGIERFGLGWKVIAKIKLPKDVPSLFEETETMTEMALLAHTICKDLINSLKKDKDILAARFLFLLPEEAFDELDRFMEELAETFVFENPEQIASLSNEALLCSCDGMEEELIYRLNELYDWGDYYRVGFSTNQ